MERYYTADLHLGHKQILSFEHSNRGEGKLQTVDEHDEWIIGQINKRVRPTDVLYILGDVAFSLEALARLKEVKCRVRIIPGNHDLFQTQCYLDIGLDFMTGSHRDGRFWLTHCPIHESVLYDNRYNLHGHLHDGTIDHWRYLNVGIDQFPDLISHSQVLNIFSERECAGGVIIDPLDY